MAQKESPKMQNGGLKWKKALQILALVELILSALLIIFAIACIAVSITYGGSPLGGSGILSGLVGTIGGGLGVGAFRAGRARRQCLFISHFVMCIIAIVLDFILIFYSAMFLIALQQYSMGREARVTATIAFSWIVLLSTLGHLICSILSSAFTCSGWCQQQDAATTVVYVSNQGQGQDNVELKDNRAANLTSPA